MPNGISESLRCRKLNRKVKGRFISREIMKTGHNNRNLAREVTSVASSEWELKSVDIGIC